ncbi:hypothetical protein, partial [Micromonospora sp. D75]|uniref:hypothetical protein n=1 Tax=Micromonospora sp. D75 TaxID=2824885 RepID=UPI001B393FDF
MPDDQPHHADRHAGERVEQAHPAREALRHARPHLAVCVAEPELAGQGVLAGAAERAQFRAERGGHLQRLAHRERQRQAGDQPDRERDVDRDRERPAVVLPAVDAGGEVHLDAEATADLQLGPGHLARADGQVERRGRAADCERDGAGEPDAAVVVREVRADATGAAERPYPVAVGARGGLPARRGRRLRGRDGERPGSAERAAGRRGVPGPRRLACYVDGRLVEGDVVPAERAVADHLGECDRADRDDQVAAFLGQVEHPAHAAPGEEHDPAGREPVGVARAGVEPPGQPVRAHRPHGAAAAADQHHVRLQRDVLPGRRRLPVPGLPVVGRVGRAGRGAAAAGHRQQRRHASREQPTAAHRPPH